MTVRNCCQTEHASPVCPDQKIQCALCFDRVSLQDLYVDSYDKVWDVCRLCGQREAEANRVPS